MKELTDKQLRKYCNKYLLEEDVKIYIKAIYICIVIGDLLLFFLSLKKILI